jgi:hypothetical protein
MVRVFVVAIAFAAASVLPAAGQAPVAPLLEATLMEGIAVRVSHRPAGIGVEVHTWPRPESQASSPLSEAVVQAWVLKPDGTAVAKRSGSLPDPVRVRSYGGTGRFWGERLMFSFDAADRQDISAVVVSLDGVLFVRSIGQPAEKK